MLDLNEARATAGIPDVGIWPDLAPDERQYRQQVLDKIARRVAADGVRHSAPSPDRGSQFMPFAALKGYEDIIANAEARADA